MLRLSRTDEQTSMTCRLASSWLDIVRERLPRRPFISGFGCVALFVAGSQSHNSSHLRTAIGWWRPRSSIWRLYNTLLVVVPAKQSSFFLRFVLSMELAMSTLSFVFPTSSVLASSKAGAFCQPGRGRSAPASEPAQQVSSIYGEFDLIGFQRVKLDLFLALSSSVPRAMLSLLWRSCWSHNCSRCDAINLHQLPLNFG